MTKQEIELPTTALCGANVGVCLLGVLVVFCHVLQTANFHSLSSFLLQAKTYRSQLAKQIEVSHLSHVFPMTVTTMLLTANLEGYCFLVEDQIFLLP